MQWIFFSPDGASTTPVGDHNTAAQLSDGVTGSTDGAADVVGTRSYTLVDASAGPIEIQLRGVNVGTDLDLVAMAGRIFQAAPYFLVQPVVTSTHVYGLASLSTVADRQLITTSNPSATGFGIATSAFHLSDDPNILGTLQGTSITCLLYTSPSPRDATLSRMPSSA